MHSDKNRNQIKGYSYICSSYILFSSCSSAWSSHCGGFSCCGTWALGTQALMVISQRHSCPSACGILPGQGWNPCSLHWQMDSYPLYHWESPKMSFLRKQSNALMFWTKTSDPNKNYSLNSENGTRRIHLVNGAEVIFIIFYLQTHAYRTFKMPYFGRYSKKIGWINACYCMTPIFSLPVSFLVCLHCAFEGGCFVLYYCFKFKLIFHFLAMPHGM